MFCRHVIRYIGTVSRKSFDIPFLTDLLDPFFVRRSRMKNLPVYLDYRNGRTRILTIVRKIEGDVSMLERMLREEINIPNLMTRVDYLTGQIVIHGNYKNIVTQYIKSLGY